MSDTVESTEFEVSNFGAKQTQSHLPHFESPPNPHLNLLRFQPLTLQPRPIHLHPSSTVVSESHSGPGTLSKQNRSRKGVVSNRFELFCKSHPARVVSVKSLELRHGKGIVAVSLANQASCFGRQHPVKARSSPADANIRNRTSSRRGPRVSKRISAHNILYVSHPHPYACRYRGGPLADSRPSRSLS